MVSAEMKKGSLLNFGIEEKSSSDPNPVRPFDCSDARRKNWVGVALMPALIWAEGMAADAQRQGRRDG